MNKFLPLVLAVVAAVPASAQEFDRGVDAGAFTRAAKDSMPGDSVAAPTPSAPMTEARRDELIRLAGGWRTNKDDARAAVNHFYDAIIRKNGVPGEWMRMLAKVWALGEQVEAVQGTVAERLMARVNNEERDPSARVTRAVAVLGARNVMRLLTYGNIIPRILDEAVTDANGAPIGRYDAGPTWKIVMTFEEATEVRDQLRAQTGFTREEYKAAEDQANAEYKAAHPGL